MAMNTKEKNKLKSNLLHLKQFIDYRMSNELPISLEQFLSENIKEEHLMWTLDDYKEEFKHAIDHILIDFNIEGTEDEEP